MKKGVVSRLLPPVIAAAALFAHVTFMYKAVLRHTAGNVSYPVDDAFIHLALAKQIAQHGMYGVTPTEFSAASSSIGWPLCLALVMKIAGTTPWLPLLVNGAFAIALFFVVDRAVLRIAPEASTLARSIVCLMVMALTPMATLVVLGMEHTAHAAATVMFVTAATTWLAEDTTEAKTSLRRVLPVAAWACATTLWRYEGMFPIALVVGLSLLRRRVRPGALVALGGAVPIVLFGLYAKAHGSHFLPTPVLLKGRHFDLKDATAYFDLLGGDLIDRFGTEGYAVSIAVACAGLAFYLIRREGFWTTNALALLVTLGTVIFHLELASVGWFYRYESYLLVTGLTFTAATLVRLLPPPRELWRACRAKPWAAAAGVAGIVVLAAPMARRSVQANGNTPLACRNIHEQQMQSARFLVTHFPNDLVAINDIGAVAWVGNDRVVDLMGLATLAVAEAKQLKLEKPLSRADMVRLTQGVKVAIVYDEWFKENLPATWLRVGKWKIDDNKSCAFPTVAIYATDPAAYPAVIEALRTYAEKLPRGVSTEGRYTNRPLVADRLRAGDRIVLAASSPDLAGGYLIDPDGTILVRSIGTVLVRGLLPEEAPASIEKQLATHSGALASAKVSRVTRVAARPATFHVGGHVSSSGEMLVAAPTIDAAVTSAGLIPSSDVAAAWIWREQANGFTKMARADLVDGALVDGDIVVVPAKGSP